MFVWISTCLSVQGEMPCLLYPIGGFFLAVAFAATGRSPRRFPLTDEDS
jgi:hypothetical protein